MATIQSTELPFHDGQWRLGLGLKPLPIETWIDIDEDVVEQLTRKSELLEQYYGEVFASLPGSQIAQQEVLDLLVAHLLRYFPQHYRQQGDWLINQITDQRWCHADFAEPLDLAARLVQEDLCLMLPSDGYRLSAASVCFPSRWRLAEKIGLPVSAIHQPVPDYDQKLERPVDQFFERLKLDYPGYRLNWSLVDSPELFLQSGHGETMPTRITAETVGEKLWLRIERQTLRRLAISNGILFTIRTRIYPLSALAADPVTAKDLAAAIQKMPPQMQQYKSILPFRSALLDYLQRRCHE